MSDSIQKIYADVPAIACKGLCTDECSVIPCSTAEAMRLPTGKPPRLRFTLAGPRCEFLVNERCSIYASRPLICRLYGVVSDMRCGHGCQPVRLLTSAECDALLDRMKTVGGRVLIPRAWRERWLKP